MFIYRYCSSISVIEQVIIFKLHALLFSVYLANQKIDCFAIPSIFIKRIFREDLRIEAVAHNKVGGAIIQRVVDFTEIRGRNVFCELIVILSNDYPL